MRTSARHVLSVRDACEKVRSRILDPVSGVEKLEPSSKIREWWGIDCGCLRAMWNVMFGLMLTWKKYCGTLTQRWYFSPYCIVFQKEVLANIKDRLIVSMFLSNGASLPMLWNVPYPTNSYVSAYILSTRSINAVNVTFHSAQTRTRHLQHASYVSSVTL